jgi:hypothetical protein
VDATFVGEAINRLRHDRGGAEAELCRGVAHVRGGWGGVMRKME